MDPTVIVPAAQEVGLADYLDIILQNILTNPVSLFRDNWVGVSAAILLVLLRNRIRSFISSR